MNFKKNILSFSICLIILVFVFYWVDVDLLKNLFRVNFYNFIISLLFALASYLISGVQYSIIRKQFGVKLKTIDIFLLPIVGNLWSFIFPFQGNLLFTTIFFKKKYNMIISESFSISIYLYLVTLSFTGIIGLLFVIYYNMIYSFLSLIFMFMILNPIFVLIFNFILTKIGNTNIKILDKIKDLISTVVLNTKKLWINYKFSLLMFLFSISRNILNILWFYWISFSFGFNLSILSIALISLIMSVSIIIKFTPDNLGVVQVITGSFMEMTGSSPGEAILITLFASATSIVLIFTIGLYGNYYYFKTINFFKLKN